MIASCNSPPHALPRQNALNEEFSLRFHNCLVILMPQNSLSCKKRSHRLLRKTAWANASFAHQITSLHFYWPSHKQRKFLSKAHLSFCCWNRLIHHRLRSFLCCSRRRSSKCGKLRSRSNNRCGQLCEHCIRQFISFNLFCRSNYLHWLPRCAYSKKKTNDTQRIFPWMKCFVPLQQ